jgi:hypothetical protein
VTERRATTAALGAPVLDAGNTSPRLAPASGQRAGAHPYSKRLLAQVRDLLGHASIITTERYDNQRLEALQAAVGRLEEGRRSTRRSKTRRKPTFVSDATVIRM